MYQSYFKDIDVSMDSPIVTEQSIKAQFAIASQVNEAEQTGDRATEYTYGQDLYAIYSNNSYTCNVTMMGCAWVQPLMYFVLNNVPMFRGTYLIEKVSHHIEPGNMVTRFTGVRMSNVCTRIARECSLRSRLEQTGDGEKNGEDVEVKSLYADIDNDCPYKVFPLTAGSGSNPESFNEFVQKVKKWEGGYAGNIDGKTCTMKGVTLDTFRHYYGANKNCTDLKNITDEQWSHIFKDGYWDKWRADEINNSSIAQLLVDWVWASGCYGLYYPQDVLGTKRNCKATDSDINAINSYPNQRELFQKLWNRRKEHFESIAKCPSGSKCKFLKGWMNRLNDFKFSEAVPTINKNTDGHISEVANRFLYSLNQTASASSSKVEIGVDSAKSKDNTLYLTNGNKSDKFANVLDMILSAYSDKVETVKWVIPGDGTAYSSVPVAYVVDIKEGSNITKILVVSESNLSKPISNIPVSINDDASGIHDSFCKALVKKYKSNTPELKNDTNHVFTDVEYEALFTDERYKIKSCNEILSEAGFKTDGENSGTASSPSEVISSDDNIMIDGWDVGKACQTLISRSRASTAHECAKYVEIAIAAGGGPLKNKISTYENGGDSYHATNLRYYGILEKHGFVMINQGIASPYGDAPIKLQSGDVAIIGNNAKKESGKFHAVMYCSKGWISDFRQKHMSPYGSTQPYAIYRFHNKQGTPKS